MNAFLKKMDEWFNVCVCMYVVEMYKGIRVLFHNLCKFCVCMLL
jgi:hypothetical protein